MLIDMTTALAFSVAGTPRPQPRPRVIRGRAVSTVDPKAKLWRGAVEKACRAAMDGRAAFAGAVEVEMRFMFLPPKSDPDRIGTEHTGAGDCDNLQKPVLDLMERAGVFKNDKQVSRVSASKVWGRKPGVAVLVRSLAATQAVPPPPADDQPPSWLTA
jgi:Holliday junction resolvase RusA-like endonuclease